VFEVYILYVVVLCGFPAITYWHLLLTTGFKETKNSGTKSIDISYFWEFLIASLQNQFPSNGQATVFSKPLGMNQF
jgi:hypothetical protein